MIVQDSEQFETVEFEISYVINSQLRGLEKLFAIAKVQDKLHSRQWTSAVVAL